MPSSFLKTIKIGHPVDVKLSKNSVKIDAKDVFICYVYIDLSLLG